MRAAIALLARALALAVAVAACGGSDVTSDAALAPDARVPAPAKTHTLYVHTDGIMLLPGEDDATNNRSSIAAQAVSLAPYLVGEPQRQALIDGVVMQVKSIVAPYDIEVVTVRPASGDYSMMVMTDDSAQVLGLAPGMAAITRSSCNQRSSPVSFAFGYPGRDYAARNAIAMFADQAAIPLSTKPGDCMCFASSVCTQVGPCTIGGPGTPIDQSAGCTTGEPTMDEAAMFLAVFGPRRD